jgi:hypothetical protein
MFEFFSAGMPLFFPSKKMIIELFHIQFIRDYWDSYLPDELSFFSDISNWLDLADFYQVFISPNVYIFDSFDHLIHLLETFEWKDDREILEQHEKNIRSEWSKLLTKIIVAQK